MMPTSVIAPDTLTELVQTARSVPPGDFVEVGVYKGGSAALLAEVAKEQGRRLYLFDTFTGMPFADPEVDRHKIGDFNDTSLEQVRAQIPYAVCVPGVFPATMLDEIGPIALAHVDCDQYESVRACCEHLAPLMASGGVMVFDDCDCLPGAAKAVKEYFGARASVSPRGKTRVCF